MFIPYCGWIYLTSGKPLIQVSIVTTPARAHALSTPNQSTSVIPIALVPINEIATSAIVLIVRTPAALNHFLVSYPKNKANKIV